MTPSTPVHAPRSGSFSGGTKESKPKSEPALLSPITLSKPRANNQDASSPKHPNTFSEMSAQLHASEDLARKPKSKPAFFTAVSSDRTVAMEAKVEM